MTLQDFAYTGNSIIETISTSNPMLRSVWSDPVTKVADLRAEPFDGRASIDYAPILRTMYRDTQAAVSGCERTYYFGKLYLKADIDKISTRPSYKFVRGASQKDLVAVKNKFLTDMPELRHYKGYPMYISYIFNESSDNVPKRLGIYTRGHVTWPAIDQELSSALTAIKKDHLTTSLWANADGVQEVDTITIRESYNYTTYPYLDDQGEPGWPYRWGTEEAYRLTTSRNPTAGNSSKRPGDTTSSGVVTGRTTHTAQPYDFDGNLFLVVNGTQTDSRPIKDYPVPQHPFYIRWINNLGGYDYFMFACDNKKTSKLTANDTYAKYGSNGYKSSYHKEAQRTIEVSTGIVPREMADCLAELIYSPEIMLWDGTQGRWFEIQVIDGKTEIKATQTCREMFFTFELQTPILNK